MPLPHAPKFRLLHLHPSLHPLRPLGTGSGMGRGPQARLPPLEGSGSNGRICLLQHRPLSPTETRNRRVHRLVTCPELHTTALPYHTPPTTTSITTLRELLLSTATSTASEMSIAELFKLKETIRGSGDISVVTYNYVHTVHLLLYSSGPRSRSSCASTRSPQRVVGGVRHTSAVLPNWLLEGVWWSMSCAAEGDPLPIDPAAAHKAFLRLTNAVSSGSERKLRGLERMLVSLRRALKMADRLHSSTQAMRCVVCGWGANLVFESWVSFV